MSNEFLESSKIKAFIEKDRIVYLSGIEVLESVDSTNTYLLNRAKEGAPSGVICFAEQQTAGRGRLGRKWISPKGVNLYLSLLWRFSEVKNISGLSIAVAVMVARALNKYGIPFGIQLKWPNDILFSERKLAGILLEKVKDAVVIGIGLNLDISELQEKKWIDMQEIMQQKVERNYFCGVLVNELLGGIPIYVTESLSAFINDWKKYDVLLNQTIYVHTPSQIIVGIMRGINLAGELLLEDEKGEIKTFSYGEVSVRNHSLS